MAEEQPQERLMRALNKIEKRIKSLEARPDREEILALKKEREADLAKIRALQAEIYELKREEK